MELLDPTDTRNDPLEDIPLLPEPAQNTLPETELPTLLLISHAHSPPLNPAPDLRFDVRSVSNPPKHIRDAYNGTSKRLQEWMQSDERFIAKRDAIKREIEEAMTKMTAGHEGDVPQQEKGSSKTYKQAETKVSQDDPSANEEASSSGSDSDDRDISRDYLKTLRVGIFCAMGRHRSVAMVEELSKFQWAGWRVEVQHRDIDKKRGAGKKGKGSRGTRGGTVHTEEHSE